MLLNYFKLLLELAPLEFQALTPGLQEIPASVL